MLLKKTSKLKKKALKQEDMTSTNKTGRPKFSNSRFILIPHNCRLVQSWGGRPVLAVRDVPDHTVRTARSKHKSVWDVCCAAPCPGDKHKAVNSWSVSGHRHPENESSKNRREELSLFPSDVQSGNFLCVFQNDSGAFETCVSAAKSRGAFHRGTGLSSRSH